MNMRKVLLVGGAVAALGGLAWYVFGRKKVDPGLIAANASPTGVKADVAIYPTTLEEPETVQAVAPSTATPAATPTGSGIVAKPVGPEVTEFMTTGELATYIVLEGNKPSHPTPLDKWVDQYVNQLDEAAHITAVLTGAA